MVGQLYKDMKIAWQAFVFLGFILAAQIIVTVEACSNPEAELESMMLIGCGILNFTAPFAAIFPVIQADESEKWICYTTILPGGITTYVQGKYVFMLIVMSATAFVSHIYSCILAIACNNMMIPYHTLTDSLYNHLPFTPMNTIILLSSSLGLLFCSLLIPLLFRFGTKAASSIVGFLTFPILIGAYCYWMFGDITFFTQENSAMLLIQWLAEHNKEIVNGIRTLPVLAIAGAITSYLIVVKGRLLQPGW